MHIKQEFDTVINQYGHDVVYVKRDERFRCSCYSERSGGAKANCSKCFGTGFKISLKKIKTRRNQAAIPETMSGATSLESGGIIRSVHYVYYIKSEVTPSHRDLILEVEWKDSKISKIIEKHFVSSAQGKKGEDGLIQFYQVYTREMIAGDYDE